MRASASDTVAGHVRLDFAVVDSEDIKGPEAGEEVWEEKAVPAVLPARTAAAHSAGLTAALLRSELRQLQASGAKKVAQPV